MVIKSAKSAFTLIEFLVVIAIIANPGLYPLSGFRPGTRKRAQIELHEQYEADWLGLNAVHAR
jgi:prepilin-type N-terminal cleavage/methylation domain-containing protein